MPKEAPDYGKYTSDLLPSENDVAPVEEPAVDPIPEGDTTKETPPEGDTNGETPAVGEETPPEPSTFEQLGLDKKYESEAEALKALKEQEKVISQHNMERQGLHDRLARLESRPADIPARREDPKIDPERFELDPQAAIEDLGYVKKEDVLSLATMVTDDALDRREAREFAASKSDFDELRPVMNQVGAQTRGLDSMSRKAATEYLYMKARELTGRTQPAPKPTIVTPAPGANNKPNANTSGGTRGGGKKATGLDQYTPEQFAKLPITEQRKILGYG